MPKPNELLQTYKARIEENGKGTSSLKQSIPNLNVIAGIGVVACLTLAGVFLVPALLPSAPPAEVNPLGIPRRVLFGFWQGNGSKAEYWIGRIGEVQGNTFTLRWKGAPQYNGRGMGQGIGTGQIAPDGTVKIDIEEELRTGTTPQLPLQGLLGSGTQSTKQILSLEGRFVSAPGGRSYFVGDYMQRGEQFYPFSTWTLGPNTPKGWVNPSH